MNDNACKYNITIIVATYNPNWDKLELTLKSALLQIDISKEIIIADDGSSINYSDRISTLMSSYHFHDFKFVHHEQNVGTVNNIYDGLLSAKGEYVYCISPGDFFYNVDTLLNLYMFAKKNNYSLCFGDAVHYALIDRQRKMAELSNNPVALPCVPGIYNKSTSIQILFLTLFNNNILGAACFRKLDFAKKYIGAFIGVSKYVEDYSSLLYAIVDGIEVGYLKSYIIWYEAGTGVSNFANKKWHELITQDNRKICNWILNNCKCKKSVRELLEISILPTKNDKIKYLFKGHFSLVFKIIFMKICSKLLPEKAHKYEIKNNMIKKIYE